MEGNSHNHASHEDLCVHTQMKNTYSKHRHILVGHKKRIDDPNKAATISKDFDDFAPENMRCIALVAHNHMKLALRAFVLEHRQALRRFRLTGTETTMRMLADVFKDDPPMFGPTCTSGPLGGDSEVASQLIREDIGAIIFFRDPLTAHPHIDDIRALARLADVHNIAVATNPMSALLMIHSIEQALDAGNKALIPGFL